jgi:hypothetical protein
MLERLLCSYQLRVKIAVISLPVSKSVLYFVNETTEYFYTMNTTIYNL